MTTRRALRARKDKTMTDHKPAEPVLSKNLAFGSIALIVVLGVVGVVLLHLFRPDASATFIQTIVTFAGILTVAITTIYGLGKLGDRVEVVQRQTNGTLSELRAEVLRKEGVIQQLHGEKVELARQLPATATVDDSAYRTYQPPATAEPPAPR